MKKRTVILLCLILLLSALPVYAATADSCLRMTNGQIYNFDFSGNVTTSDGQPMAREVFNQTVSDVIVWRVDEQIRLYPEVSYTKLGQAAALNIIYRDPDLHHTRFRLYETQIEYGDRESASGYYYGAPATRYGSRYYYAVLLDTDGKTVLAKSNIAEVIVNQTGLPPEAADDNPSGSTSGGSSSGTVPSDNPEAKTPAGLPKTVPSAQISFSDVKVTDWFYEDVRTAYGLGLIEGRSADSYAPDANLSYCEAVKLAAVIHQLYNDGAVSFPEADPWYDPYFDYALRNNILKNDWRKTLDVTRPITRSGYVHLFYASLPSEEYNAVNTVAFNAVPDVTEALTYPESEIWRKEVYNFYRAGILAGDDYGNFLGDTNIRRSEVAAILSRMLFRSSRVLFTMNGD